MCTHSTIAENLWDSKDLQAVEVHPVNGATGVWIASHSCGNERCEESAETASSDDQIQNLKNRDEDHSSVSAKNLMDARNVQRDDRQTGNEGTGLIIYENWSPYFFFNWTFFQINKYITRSKRGSVS